MKKSIAIVLSLCAVSFLYGKEPPSSMYDNLKIDRVNNLTKLNTSEENKVLNNNSNYIKQIKNELAKNLDKSAVGYANISFIIDSKDGKIMKYLIKEKEGDENFNQKLKIMLEKTSSIKLEKQNFPNPIIEVFVSFGTKTSVSTVENWSLLATKENLYKEYLTYIIKTKGIPKEKVKAILNSDKDSPLKSLLYAIYYDFEKKDPKAAKEYYDDLIGNNLESLAQTKEAFIAADYLLRQNRFQEIMTILPERSCSLFQGEDKYTCYYYQAFAQYKLKKDYTLALNIAKNHSIVGEKLYNKIKKEQEKSKK